MAESYNAAGGDTVYLGSSQMGTAYVGHPWPATWLPSGTFPIVNAPGDYIDVPTNGDARPTYLPAPWDIDTFEEDEQLEFLEAYNNYQALHHKLQLMRKASQKLGSNITKADKQIVEAEMQVLLTVWQKKIADSEKRAEERARALYKDVLGVDQEDSEAVILPSRKMKGLAYQLKKHNRVSLFLDEGRIHKKPKYAGEICIVLQESARLVDNDRLAGLAIAIKTGREDYLWKTGNLFIESWAKPRLKAFIELKRG